MRKPGLLVLLALSAPTVAGAQQTVSQYTRGMEKRDGFIPFYWDTSRGRLLLEISRFGEEFLYFTSLATGLGSDELGLDRGMAGNEYLARFDRHGPRVHLVLANPGFRASSENQALVRSVAESFPVSTVASFEILAEEAGRVLVDATPYFLSDAMDVRSTLRRAATSVALDRDRSAIYLARTKAFPQNTEIEASLTFALENPGAEVRRHAPDGRSVTLRQHHSLVKFPEPGYRPRKFDPRIGFFSVSFYDFAKPFDQDYVTRYVVRHRLVKKDPAAAQSEPVKPIVYYLDPAIPEPYRSAFRDGAMWWNRVFEAAGFVNAFRVEDMPPDMDPLDARYHVIQWFHRSEAGSSVGPSFVDPRTGEIIKSAVRMDSHRSLPDFDIYAAVRPAVEDYPDPFLTDLGWGEWIASLDQSITPQEFAMARRQQHAAHEVGHTLGLAHNFIAASYGRASVMDYPAPLIRLVNGRIDLREAYRPGPGAYDSIAIRYGYTQFPEGEEERGLAAIIEEATRRGLKFVTNPDEGSSGSYPEASTWVNGSDMVEELARVMEVRRYLMDRFDERAIAPGDPMHLLNQRFTTVYLHHRFTLLAAVKAVGGMEFRYAVRGDAAPPTAIVPPARQRRALALLLDALEPRELAIPERILVQLAPRPFGYTTSPRAFSAATGHAFDQLGAARVVASLVLGGLFDPVRASRIVALQGRNPELPSLEEVIGRVIDRTWTVPAPPEPGLAQLKRLVQRVVVDELIDLAASDAASVEARAGAEWGLRRILDMAGGMGSQRPEEQSHLDLVVADIERFLSRPEVATKRSVPPAEPRGVPIGKP